MGLGDDEKVNWNVDLEVSLFHAIHAHRPVGVNRHFQMIFLHDKFNSSIDRKISTKEIWNHLTEMYDLVALNESDGIPFPNMEADFALPETLADEHSEKPFPRCTLSNEAKTTESIKRRDSTKDVALLSTSTETATSKPALEPKGIPVAAHQGKELPALSDASLVDRQMELVTKTPAAVDSPKTDNRKRTRQSLHTTQAESTTPTATAAGTPSAASAKRSRRT